MQSSAFCLGVPAYRCSGLMHLGVSQVWQARRLGGTGSPVLIPSIIRESFCMPVGVSIIG